TPALYNNQGSFAHIDLYEPALRGPLATLWLSLVLIFGVSLLFADNRIPHRSGTAGGDGRLCRMLYVTCALIASDFALNVWLTGGLASFLNSHWYLREAQELQRLGSFAVVLTHLEQAVQAAFTACAMRHAYWQIRSRTVRLGTNLLVAVFLTAQVVMTGNRIFMAVYLSGLTASLWYCHRRRAFALLLATAPLIAVAFSLWS